MPAAALAARVKCGDQGMLGYIVHSDCDRYNNSLDSHANRLLLRVSQICPFAKNEMNENTQQ